MPPLMPSICQPDDESTVFSLLLHLSGEGRRIILNIVDDLYAPKRIFKSLACTTPIKSGSFSSFLFRFWGRLQIGIQQPVTQKGAAAGLQAVTKKEG